MEMEVTPAPAEGEQKKARKRIKLVQAQIREQMEFYFSDANLRKDRFIMQEVKKSEDGYIELELFSKFNKIRALTADMTVVAKALSSSELLEVSADKKNVRRTKPLLEETDIDDRTVYVECLPHVTDINWIKKTFQECGKVVYVSLPKYHSTRDLKGFAFVEFETKDGADKACQMLNNPPASAPDRIGMFPKSNKKLDSLERQTQKLDESRDPRIEKRNKRQRTVSESAASENGGHTSKKRMRTTSECSDTLHHAPAKQSSSEPDIAKRLKVDHKGKECDGAEGLGSDPKLHTTIKESHPEGPDNDTASRKRRHDTDSSEEESKSEPGTISPKKVRISEEVTVEISSDKKKKKRNKKNKKKNKDVAVKEVPELRVIPKKQWLSLRTEYLELQKSSMKQLKKTLQEQTKPLQEQTKPMSTQSQEPSTKTSRQIEYTPNVIVKISGKNPFMHKEVKEIVKKVATVSYVDVSDGATEGFIRCTKEEEAVKLIKDINETHTYTLLTGEEEKQYWSKIQADRLDRINKPKNKAQNQNRGRDKIFKRAEKIQKAQQKKHIIFEDD